MIARLRRSDVLLHSAVVFGGVVFANAVNFLFYAVVGRIVSVETYGAVLALVSLMLLVGAPATYGQLLVARIAADLASRDDHAGLRRLADVVTFRILIAGAVLLLVAVAIRIPAAEFLHLGDPASIPAAAAATGLFVLVYVQRGVLQGAQKFNDFSFSSAFEALCRVGLGIALVRLFGASGAMAGMAAGLGCAALYNMWRFARYFPRIDGTRLAAHPEFGRMLRGIGTAQLTLAALMFYDVPLIKHAFDARSAGLYAAAALVGRAIMSVTQFVPTIVLPKAVSRDAEGLAPGPVLVTALSLAGLVVGIAVVAAGVAPGFVVQTIAGHAFGSAAPLTFPYVLASGALAFAGVVSSYNIGLHRYAFAVAAALVAGTEIVAFAWFHPTLQAAVTILAAGHVLVLAATFLSVRFRARASRGDEIVLTA